MILGANPREYRPSLEELILAEIGERIEKILDFYPKKEVLKILGKAKKDLKKAKFRKFTFIHSDAMGSGRFFYVDKIQESEINLK
jgi:hypothetical protein